MWAAFAFPVLNFEFSRSWLRPTLRFFTKCGQERGGKSFFEGWETISKQSLVWLDISEKIEQREKLRGKKWKRNIRNFDGVRFSILQRVEIRSELSAPPILGSKIFLHSGHIQVRFCFCWKRLNRLGESRTVSNPRRNWNNGILSERTKKREKSQIISPHLHGQMDQYPRSIKPPIRPRDLGESWN